MSKKILVFGCSVVLALLFYGSTVSADTAKTNTMHCEKLLSNAEVEKVYRQNALNQLALEFGRAGSFIYEVNQFPVDAIMVKLESYARYQKPGQKDLARMRLNAWVNRCNGTTIIRGNTWLADGSLKVLRYSAQELEGRGLIWGSRDAPMKFIVYVDSRCPNCHRLLDYARKLIESGQVMLDIRQIAYLENKKDAILDTRLSQTSLVMTRDPEVSNEEYIQLLGGDNNVEQIDTGSTEYRKAHHLISRNTATAEKVLHLITVPGVLIQEKEYNNLYRRMGYWEINRIFQ